MKILGVHFETEEGRVRKNVERAVELIRSRIKEQPADLVVLPEMFTCGYCSMDLRPFAEAADGPSVRTFSDLANELDVVIGFGFVEQSAKDKPYNSYALIEPHKPAHLCRKTHLHISQPGSIINEPEFLQAGDSLGIVDTRLGRVGIMICYDGHFAEVPRSLVLGGADFIIWPNRSGGLFSRNGFVTIRALENVIDVICVDGSEAGESSPLIGRSIIADYKGQILADFEGAEGTLYADIDLTLSQEERQKAVDLGAVYRVRRPELYSPITEVGKLKNI